MNYKVVLKLKEPIQGTNGCRRWIVPFNYDHYSALEVAGYFKTHCTEKVEDVLVEEDKGGW